MAEFAKLDPAKLTELRRIDERLVSYNVEMTEITGGTFWKAYTEAQIDGTQPFPPITNWQDMGNLQQWYDPIDTKHPRLIRMAKELGPAWVRVSGTWANKTYYDFDGHTGGKVPEGFQNLLTKAQWLSLLDFVKAVGGKLLVSIANCPGIHKASEPMDFGQADLLFRTSKEYGVPISAAEFTNEPNLAALSGLPEGYTPADHARDHDLFGAWLKENYPECLFVGPCTVGDIDMFGALAGAGGGMAAGFKIVTTEELLGENKSKLDVFSYHYYNGVSERGQAMGGHWPYEAVLTEEYLDIAPSCARQYVARRDRYVPGGQMWVTESGDAGCGGNTWASTYADVPRTLNELGAFCTITDGVIFHNTLASSDYGFLKHGTFEPRPNYFAVLLWNRLMGPVAYDTAEPVREGVHVYCHSRKDGKPGYVYLLINNSRQPTMVDLPVEATRYTLTGNGKLRSRTMLLNGRELKLGHGDQLPELEGAYQEAGTIRLAPASCTFLVI
ncbi:MAG: beta-glucuronidase [Oscillospiraceae bacterium]|nr:beta-glucuronidase [Oscillospiraceae bacterium]